MKSFYKLSIPKPCHENWSEMTPNEKGRFCKSCTKTVVDFTKMNTNEIKSYIDKNKNQRICGHINQVQLDTVNLQISESIFNQTLSFHKLFLLALLVAMGTSLFNCSDEKGNTKKIESVQIVAKTYDSLLIKKISKDSLKNERIKNKKEQKSEIETPPVPVLTGEVIGVVDGLMEIEPIGEPYMFFDVDEIPKFYGTSIKLSKEENLKYFQEKVNNIVVENFLVSHGHLNLSGIQRIFIQFEIDSSGLIQDIHIRAPHQKLEEEAKRVIKLIPKLIPAKFKGETVSTIYNLPITFKVED